MTLDITTLYVASVLTTTVAGLIFLYTSGQSRSAYAIRVWGISLLLSATGAALLALESSLLPSLVEISAVSLVLLSYGLFWTAARIFEHRKPIWHVAGAGCALWLGMSIIPGISAHKLGTSLFIVTALGGYILATAFEIARDRTEKLASRPLAAAVLTLYGLLFAAYIPVLLHVDLDSGTLRNSQALAVLLLIAYVHWFTALFLLLKLVKERGEQHHRRAALIDPLTAVGNRRHFMREASFALAKSQRRKQSYAVLIADLDHFKRVNDSFGHAVGDAVLRRFGAVARDCLRHDQVFGRIGGEEFGFFLPGANAAEARDVAERIRGTFVAAAATVDGQAVDAHVTIGGCVSSHPMDTLAALMSGADAALYTAKTLGRNRVEIHELCDSDGQTRPRTPTPDASAAA